VAVSNDLRDSVAEFNSALTNYAARIGFHTYEMGTQTLNVAMQALDVGNRTFALVDGWLLLLIKNLIYF
jgi:hypothetical protein